METHISKQRAPGFTNCTGTQSRHTGTNDSAIACGDIVTIVRDPRHILGKQFQPNGSKRTEVNLALGMAEQRLVPTPADMVAVLKEISEDPRAAIINASFREIPINEHFVILSESQFRQRLRIKKRDDMLGVHHIEIREKGYKAVGRFKENVRPSSWQLLDRDVDEHSPRKFGDMTYDQWLTQIACLFPGFMSAARIHTLSSSARVLQNGTPLGAGNGHTWVQLENVEDVERIRSAGLLRAIELGLSWRKPRFSRLQPDKVIGHSLTTIIDLSVWTPGRLVFNGKPTAARGMTVLPQHIEVTSGGRLDTSLLHLPDPERVRSITRTAGIEMRYRRDEHGSLVFDAHDLSYKTEIELKDGTVTTVRDALATLRPESKLRCQTPFRASQSEAAFLSRGKDGRPFIYDSGTNTTHWINEDEEALEGFECLVDDQTKGPEKRVSRRSIKYTPEDMTKQAGIVEKLICDSAAEGEYVTFGGVLSDVRARELPYTHLIDDPDQAPPPIPVLEPIDAVRMRELVEREVVFFVKTQHGIKNIAVPPKIIEILIQKKVHSAPKVTGLLTHPIVLSDETILAKDGLHSQTGLFLRGAAIEGAVAYSQAEAKSALLRLRELFLEDFAFESAFDKEIAISALLTGVQRRILGQAPGYLLTAPQQSSGKTTLARRLHVILTGHDLPVSSFPENDETEMQKRLLAMLLRSPAMVCLDNVTDGLTFRSSAISAVMTSSILIQRVLGVSREAECPTNVLMVVTGNNVSLGTDENTRWLICRLNPKTARPHERRFTHSDVISHALSIRETVLRDAVGIIAGYITSRTSLASASRFAQWDRFVRQSLIWAGGQDVGRGFVQNLETSEDVGAHRCLMVTLKQLFGDDEFSATAVANLQSSIHPPTRIERLEEALAHLRARDPRNAMSVGRALSAVVGRIAETNQEGHLRLDKRTIDGLPLYRVVREEGQDSGCPELGVDFKTTFPS